jgi:hypothetical protein
VRELVGTFSCQGQERCDFGRKEAMVDKDKIDQQLTDAGWEPDGTFSEHLAIGESGDLCVLVHRSTWETDEPAYELYDAGRQVSYWVHEVPTPEQADKLLEEHGGPPDEAE